MMLMLPIWSVGYARVPDVDALVAEQNDARYVLEFNSPPRTR